MQWNSPYFPPMTPDVISMQQHVTGRELWFWTLPVFHVFGAVSCPAAPDPTWHLPYVPSLPPSVTVPHTGHPLYIVKHGMKGQTSRGKIHVRGGGKKAQACSSALQVAIYIYLKSLIEVSTYWIPKWTSLSNKVKTVKYESALFNYVAIESSLYRHFLGRLPVASLSLVARQEFAKAILKIIKS